MELLCSVVYTEEVRTTTIIFMHREKFILLMGLIATCMYVFKQSRELWPDVCT